MELPRAQLISSAPFVRLISANKAEHKQDSRAKPFPWKLITAIRFNNGRGFWIGHLLGFHMQLQWQWTKATRWACQAHHSNGRPFNSLDCAIDFVSSPLAAHFPTTKSAARGSLAIQTDDLVRFFLVLAFHNDNSHHLTSCWTLTFNLEFMKSFGSSHNWPNKLPWWCYPM